MPVIMSFIFPPESRKPMRRLRAAVEFERGAMLRPFWKPQATQRQRQEPAPPSMRGQKNLSWTAPNLLRLPIPVSLTSEFVLAPSPQHPFDPHRPHRQLDRK